MGSSKMRKQRPAPASYWPSDFNQLDMKVASTAQHDRIAESHNRRGSAAKDTTTDRIVSMAVEGPSSGIICHLVASSVELLRPRKAQKGSQDQLLLGHKAEAMDRIIVRIDSMNTLKQWMVSPKESSRSSVIGNNHKACETANDP